MALFHLLDFGSSFDSLLLAKTGKGEVLILCSLTTCRSKACTSPKGEVQRRRRQAPAAAWRASHRQPDLGQGLQRRARLAFQPGCTRLLHGALTMQRHV